MSPTVRWFLFFLVFLGLISMGYNQLIRIEDQNQIKEATEHAINNGYRHVEVYNTEGTCIGEEPGNWFSGLTPEGSKIRGVVCRKSTGEYYIHVAFSEGDYIK